MTTVEPVEVTASAIPALARDGLPAWGSRLRRLAPTLLGIAVLALVVVRVGVGPFVDGVRSTSAASILVAVVIGAVTTVACAVRWRSVSSALGSELALGHAVAAVYRAQLLNVVLPGGVVGDVHRGASHWRRPGGRGAARAVAWERFGGQVVLAVLAVGVLAVHPVGLARATVVAVAAVAVVVTLVGVRVLRADRLAGRRAVRAVSDDLDVLASPRLLAVVVVTSTVVVVGHAVTFLVAARTAGVAVPWISLVPVAILVLVAMSVPTHVAGWGIREGVAAWAFAAAGLGAAAGVRATVVYAVITTVAVLPGVVVLLAGRLHPNDSSEVSR
jgi:uncharacterized membrane protein YbhN (UPF0104 family)